MRDRDGVHPEGGALRQDADEDGGPPLPSPTPAPDILQVSQLKRIFGFTPFPLVHIIQIRFCVIQIPKFV